MRQLVSAFILTTALCTSSVFAEEAAAPGTPAFNSTEELNAHLSKDLHETRSKEYEDTAKRKDIIAPVKRLPSKEAEEKYYENRRKDELNNRSSAGKTSRPLEEGENPDGTRVGEENKAPAFKAFAPPMAIAKPKLDIRTPATPTPPAGLSTLPSSTALHPTAPGNPTAPVAAELSDGTQALFGADGKVSIVSSDGRYRAPPDGVLTLKDGTSFTVEGGARVDK
jgi:hypothetical protein